MRARCLILAIALIFAARVGQSDDTLEFNRDIRPILSDKCFRCHGPDENERQASLRFDQSDSALAELDSGGYAIRPGRPVESRLIERITSDDPEFVMPPPESGKSLTAEESRQLRLWIEQGASWSEHWSFRPPTRLPLPAVQDLVRTTNPIDRFVGARLEREQIQPSPEASRETLIRRLTFDLTGLPPSVAEIDDYLSDRSPNAYERVVDRLLQSPRYGEHQTRYWLDVARYGDTHGLHLDNQRTIWPYRDWLIDAFNWNMPFDQFTVEQLAGDLLANATERQKVATGFNRCNVTTSEGGSIDEEYLVRYAIDRVETTSTVWLGLTIGCAVCHDHKFDPISQREFYGLFAYFFSQTERAMDGNAALPPPSVKAPTSRQRLKRDQWRSELEQCDSQLAQMRRQADHRLSGWVDDYREAMPTNEAPVDAIIHCRLDEADGEIVSFGGDETGKINGTPLWDAGKLGDALRFDGQTHVDLGSVGRFQRTDPFSLGAWVYPEGEGQMTILSRMDDTSTLRGYDLYLDEGTVAFHLVSAWDDDAICVTTRRKLSANVWQHLFATYDGSGKASGVTIFIDGAAQELKITHDNLQGTIETDQSFRIGHRTSAAPFRGIIDELRVYARTLEADEVRSIVHADPLADIVSQEPDHWTVQQRDDLLDYFMRRHRSAYLQLVNRRRQMSERIRRFEGSFSSTLVMQEMSKRRQAHLLIRGQYDRKGEPIEPGVPAVLPNMRDDLPQDRLSLARWLVDRSHPLTARVTVNRIWQQYFGAGIVKTSEDFGSQGGWPSHPGLLDWLAVEFIDSGWDIKALHRLIVTSSTYRQSSSSSPESYRQDPENRLLARGPRFRLDGEMIRDTALAVSGLLVDRLGGPSVKPYQPDGLWSVVGYTTSNTAQFVQDHGESLYRRSIYTFWKRTSPPPTMQILDAPSREVCTVRRPRTNAPSAALVLMNDVQFVEAARHLALLMLAQGSDTNAITFGFRSVTARRPDEEEREILTKLLDDYRRQYQADANAARQLIGVGESRTESDVDVAQLAAWTMVASTLLNLDETVTKP